MRTPDPDRREAWARRLDRVRVELEAAPDRGALWLKRARLQWMLGARAGARRSIVRAAELDARSPLVHAWRARMAVESRAFDVALAPLARAAELDPRDATVRWIRGRWGLELARVARRRGDLVTARELLARVDRERAGAVLVELELLAVDELDPDASTRERRQRLVRLARSDERLRRATIDAIREQNELYRGLARLARALPGARGRWTGLSIAAASVTTIAIAGASGGWRLLGGIPELAPEGSSPLACCAQAVAGLALLGLFAMREAKIAFLVEHVSAAWLVDEARHPGLLTDVERATGLRCTLYVLAPIVAMAMLALPDLVGAQALPLVLAALPIYQWKRMHPGWWSTAFGACTLVAVLAIVADAIGSRGAVGSEPLSPWYAAALAWMLVALPLGIVLRRFAARAA